MMMMIMFTIYIFSTVFRKLSYHTGGGGFKNPKGTGNFILMYLYDILVVFFKLFTVIIIIVFI